MTTLSVFGSPPWSALTTLWERALRPLVVRHPNRESQAVLTLIDGTAPSLQVALDKTVDSRDPTIEMRRFIISNVKLTFWPGEFLARAWFAAAWGGYIQHEALELVTIGDTVTRPLDPHAPPYTCDRGLREGLPVELTPATLLSSLAVVMHRDAARRMVQEHGGDEWPR